MKHATPADLQERESSIMGILAQMPRMPVVALQLSPDRENTEGLYDAEAISLENCETVEKVRGSRESSCGSAHDPGLLA
jgi:hypothetical protein